MGSAQQVETRDVAASGVSAQNAWSQVIDSQLRPPRAAGIKVSDDGTGATQLVDFLVERKLI